MRLVCGGLKLQKLAFRWLHSDAVGRNTVWLVLGNLDFASKSWFDYKSSLWVKLKNLHLVLLLTCI
jgi:hypothetical protein